MDLLVCKYFVRKTAANGVDKATTHRRQGCALLVRAARTIHLAQFLNRIKFLILPHPLSFSPHRRVILRLRSVFFFIITHFLAHEFNLLLAWLRLILHQYHMMP